MATQAYPYLALTDGTTTITFADGSGGLTNYPPVRDTWSPNVPVRRRSELGGAGSYTDVDHEFSINITGATASAAMANLASLAKLLDQAERWYDEEPVSPVLLKYAPQGSTISSTASPLQALVLGRAPGDETAGIALPVTYNSVGLYYEISDVKVRLHCRIFLGASETVTSSSGNSGDILSASWSGSVGIPSPCRIGFTSNVPSLTNGAILLFAKASGSFKVIEAETMTGTAYTSVADSGAQARGGSVLRYTPTGTTVAQSGTVASTFSGTYKTAIYAVVRNNSATTSWQVEFVTTPSSGNISVRTAPVLIDASTTNPRPICLGILTNRAGSLASYNLRITASAASGTLDIDYIVLMDLADETSRAITLPATSLGNIEIGCDPMPLSGQRAVVGSPSGSAGNPYVGFVSYSGDPFLTSSGGAVAGVILAPYANNWRAYSGSLVNFSLRATRCAAYLVPQ